MRLDRPKMPPDGSSGVILPPRGKDGGQRVKPDPLNLHKYRRHIVLLDGVASLNVKKHGGSQSRLVLGYEGSRSKLNHREKEPFLILLSAGKACDNLWDMYKKMVFT